MRKAIHTGHHKTIYDSRFTIHEMKILIIGGTRFVGRHLVAAGLQRNHEITLFNRGQSSSERSKGVETIHGDRHCDLNNLQGRRWDAVIDTCGYLPRAVAASAGFLSQSVETYVFISSQSVYVDFSAFGLDENAPLQTLTNEQLDKANAIDSSGQNSAMTYGDMYGGLKALCEQAAEQAMPNRVLTIRPGLIVGPFDHTDRFTYWPVRVARGGEVLAPGTPDKFVQFIDARDLAEWVVTMVENRGTGIFNASCKPSSLKMKNVLDESKIVSGSDASFTWVDETFLFEEKVLGWSHMPLWFPESATQFNGFMFINCDKAFAAGLTSRPLSATISDTLEWYRAQNVDEPLKAGISSDRELELLKKWHEAHQ